MLHRNLGLKLIAFVVAVALWGWVLVNQRTVSSARTVPVAVHTTGALPEGVRLLSIRVEPPVVTVTGPEEDLSDTRAVDTADLPLDRITTRRAYDLALIAPPGIHLLRTNRVRVLVRVAPEARPQAQEPPSSR